MNRIVKFCCKAFMLAAMVLSPALASAEGLKFNRFFVVGDSLSDGGAYSNTAKFSLINGGLFSPPDVNYKFTNANADGSSKIWNDFLSEKFGIVMSPNIINGVPLAGILPPPAGMTPEEIAKYNELVNTINVGGNNYAQGGSRVEGTSISQDLSVGATAIPVHVQVDRLLSDVGGKFRKNDLVAVWAGANDAFAYATELDAGTITVGEALANLTGTASALEGQINRLQQAGAKNIIIMTVPVGNLTATPTLPLFQHYNSELKALRNGKDGLVIDFSRLVDATTLEPVKYGFTSLLDGALTTPACVDSSLACIDGINTNPGGPFVRADDVHLSQQSNSNFAEFIFGSIKAASQNAIITTTTLSTLRQHGLSLEDRLSPGAFDYRDKSGRIARRNVGHIKGYASIEGGYFETDAGQIDPGTSASTQSLRVGGDMVVSSNALIGVSLSFNRGDVDYDDNSGGFDSRTYIGSLYANVALTKSTYVNAVLGAGHIDLNDVTRRFNIGPNEEVNTGDTNGDYRLARIGAGFVLPMGRWSINPAAAYSYERVKIDGYSETTGPTSMAFGDNEIESSRVTASLTATYNPKDPDGWTPMFRVSIEHEFEDDDLKVNLGPDSDTIGALYLERPDGTYGYLTGGISKKIGESTSFSVNATTVIGQDGVTGVSGGISIKSKF